MIGLAVVPLLHEGAAGTLVVTMIAWPCRRGRDEDADVCCVDAPMSISRRQVRIVQDQDQDQGSDSVRMARQTGVPRYFMARRVPVYSRTSIRLPYAGAEFQQVASSSNSPEQGAAIGRSKCIRSAGVANLEGARGC